ncbi:transcriptional regulator [Burkholderia sp. 9120]|uniref:transcriptional regulator n=1 Tax=Burkholderia sp. 9120 TaxID=1500897 RepID=UPI00054E14CC|nr:transcriptional regulator [Burkholderia sp. 9120]
MSSKRTMTLNLTDAEMTVLEQLCEQKDMSKTAVLRQALRLYQLLDNRMQQGEKLFLEDPLAKEKKEVVVL